MDRLAARRLSIRRSLFFLLVTGDKGVGFTPGSEFNPKLRFQACL
jgi:hypothetical protein